jgi:hypothetical protein
LFLYHIHKKIPSGFNPIYSRLLYGTLLPISFPPMFDMGESLKECEGDIFLVGKIMNRVIQRLFSARNESRRYNKEMHRDITDIQ